MKGLRREEVASLAGVSVESYRRRERGNAGGASDGVLEALAGALHLDEAELSGSWTAASSPLAPNRKALVARFDMSLPENQRKLEVVGELATVAADAGLSLIELAIAFTANHPALPRRSSVRAPWSTWKASSRPPTARSTLRCSDRIEEIVRPGVNLNLADTSYGEQVLAPALRRR